MESDIVLPFLGGAFGTCLSAAVTLAALRHSEIFRKLARWEPFGQRLWDERLKLYLEWMPAIHDASTVTQVYVSYAVDTCRKHGSDTTKAMIADHFKTALPTGRLAPLEQIHAAVQRMAVGELISSAETLRAIAELMDCCRKAYHDANSPQTIANVDREKITNLYFAVYNATRKEIGANALSRNVADIVLR